MCDLTQRFDGSAGADATKEPVDLPGPLFEIGAQDRRLLVIGDLLDLHRLCVAAECEPRVSTDADVPYPLRFTSGRHEVPLTREVKEVDGRAVPFAGPPTLYGQHAGTLDADAALPSEKRYDGIDDSRGEESRLDDAPS